MDGNIIVIAVLAVIIAVALFFTIRRIKYGSSCCGSKDVKQKKVHVKDKNRDHYPYVYKMEIDGMHCSGCVRKIENSFNAKEGMWAIADLEKKELMLRCKEKLNRENAGDTVSSAGFILLSFEEIK